MKKITLILFFSFSMPATIYLDYPVDIRYEIYPWNYIYNKDTASLGYFNSIYRKNNFSLDFGTAFTLMPAKRYITEGDIHFKEENKIYSIYLNTNYHLNKELYVFLKIGWSFMNNQTFHYNEDGYRMGPGDFFELELPTFSYDGLGKKNGLMFGAGLYLNFQDSKWGIGCGYNIYARSQVYFDTKEYYETSFYIGYDILNK